MPLIENENPYSVSPAPLMAGLGGSFDRAAFTKAAKVFRELDQAASDLRYPKKFDAVREVLKRHGIRISEEQADKVFEQMLEAERTVLASQIRTTAIEMAEEAIAPRVHALQRKLGDKMREEAEKLETRERAEAERWRIPFHPSMTLLSLQSTADRLSQTTEGRVWNGEPPEKLLSAWFEKPIEI